MPEKNRPCCGHSTELADYFLTRRQFLTRIGCGIGALSLATLLDPAHRLAAAPGTGTTSPLAPKPPHFPGRARAVIHIFAQGAPSHVDTWDPKPALARLDGRKLPDGGVAFASPFSFRPRGQSGIEVSELFERTGAFVDDMAVIRSMHTDIPAHDVATVFMNTGSLRIARPSLGSWVVYGLGTENENLPGFIALRTGGLPAGGAANYQSAFLPGIYQGTTVNVRARSVYQMLQNIRSPYLDAREQRRQLELVHQLNEIHAETLHREQALETRLEACEVAFRMQAEATDAFDIHKEPEPVRQAYGDTPQGHQLLIARRLVERGVRFVQVWHDGWDHHQDLQERITAKAREIDTPLAALLGDLKQRGLLDSTLVIWGGEFGRKPSRDRNGSDTPGRDHNASAFTIWMAGGGIRGGTIHGATDEIGARAVQDKVHVHDLHATILHALGFDHTRLTYRFNGRDFRLTDVAGNVIHDILA
ncbi:MAG: DUF1501 domain-containing protein [Verrucomicrobia bacterium]|nr:MAG: DUF1501 domain-containing protein [Verrucomicrobiota bacterium]